MAPWAVLTPPPFASGDFSLGWRCLQRDWLSANHIVFDAGDRSPATVVDTGHAGHAEMSLSLIDHALSGQHLGRIINTHLHSDHCGGNHALQARDPRIETLVPAASFEAVQAWDADRLSYQATGQHCVAFKADATLRPGQTIVLGPALWQVHAAPGHDPDAVLLFEPQTRTLIAGDALWEDRLAIIFPELEDQPGFAQTRRTLDLIEQLQPRRVIPGHGPVFEDVQAALASSRSRLSAFERSPQRHVRHAARALTMFHMMEVREQPRQVLMAWLTSTPLFLRMAASLSTTPAAHWAADMLSELLDEGLLIEAQLQIRLVTR